MKNLIKETARTLRNKSTEAEIAFWNSIRNRNISGKKFLRQHPIRCDIDGQKSFFIADFYCASEKLIVEIDGGIHEYQREYDTLRTYIVEKLGMRVVRFKNEEVQHNIDDVIVKLKREFS